MNTGAYQCHLTLSDPDGWAQQVGGPASAFVQPAAGSHGLPPLVEAPIAAMPPTLNKQQRYDVRMKKLAAARARLGDTPAFNPLAAPADATRIGAVPGVDAQQRAQTRLQAATDRLARNNVAVERAKLADDSYNNDQVLGPDGVLRNIHREKQDDGTYLTTQPPDGWHVARVIKGEQSGFMAVVYTSDFERPPRPVVAFRGTDADPNFPAELKKDGATDALQGMGFYTDAYKQTENVARKLKKEFGSSLDITGHSLGGGEASLASLVTGNNAYTFNSAGLHENSIARAGIATEIVAQRQKNICAYFSDQDPLNWNQDHSSIIKGIIKKALPPYTPLGMPSIPSPLDPFIDDPRTMPVALGTRYKLKDGGGHWSPAMIDGAGHSVPPMVAAIEKQKDEDLATIDQLVPAAR